MLFLLQGLGKSLATVKLVAGKISILRGESNQKGLLASSAARFQQFNRQHDIRFFFSVDVDIRKNIGEYATTPRLSVAIVGAGPSGFYAAKYLTSSVLKRIHQSTATEPPLPSFNWSGIDIDIIERLPTPYGLVRYGVAPDHPEVKNVENDFASLFQTEANNENASLSYFGNIDVGKDISLSQLQSMYNIVILAYGCQSSDRRLGIPGEDTLEGILSAREFVAWYNGHPEFGHIGSIVKQCLWPSGQGSEKKQSNNMSIGSAVSPARVVVIGQGNVALDVARVLAKGKDGLIKTDTPSTVLDVLQGGVSHVSIVGRRGHVQGACKEALLCFFVFHMYVKELTLVSPLTVTIKVSLSQIYCCAMGVYETE